MDPSLWNLKWQIVELRFICLLKIDHILCRMSLKYLLIRIPHNTQFVDSERWAECERRGCVACVRLTFTVPLERILCRRSRTSGQLPNQYTAHSQIHIGIIAGGRRLCASLSRSPQYSSWRAFGGFSAACRRMALIWSGPRRAARTESAERWESRRLRGRLLPHPRCFSPSSLWVDVPAGHAPALTHSRSLACPPPGGIRRPDGRFRSTRVTLCLPRIALLGIWLLTLCFICTTYDAWLWRLSWNHERHVEKTDIKF